MNIPKELKDAVRSAKNRGERIAEVQKVFPTASKTLADRIGKNILSDATDTKKNRELIAKALQGQITAFTVYKSGKTCIRTAPKDDYQASKNKALKQLEDLTTVSEK